MPSLQTTAQFVGGNKVLLKRYSLNHYHQEIPTTVREKKKLRSMTVVTLDEKMRVVVDGEG